MKREFLRNFKVGELSLPEEVIDAIMAENGRDIEAAKKPFADYENIKEQLQTAKDGLKKFEGVDVGQLQGQVATLQKALADKDEEWQTKVDSLAFEGKLKEAITAAKGKSAKAITALLDTDALKASKNQDADIKAALENLKKESDFLFESGETPPPYAPGTGMSHVPGAQYPPDVAAIRAAAGLKND